eukprot:SAG31_NODE_751_length_12354_cov_14.018605_2_plen_224_part_00
MGLIEKYGTLIEKVSPCRKPGAIASGLTAPFHLILCLVFFKVLETDYLGGAQAMAISGVANTAFLIMIVRVRGLHGKTWGAQMPSGTGQQASRGNWQLSVPSPFEHSWEEVKLFLQLAGAGKGLLSRFCATIREIRDFDREMYGTNRESVCIHKESSACRNGGRRRSAYSCRASCRIRNTPSRRCRSSKSHSGSASTSRSASALQPALACRTISALAIPWQPD